MTLLSVQEFHGKQPKTLEILMSLRLVELSLELN